MATANEIYDQALELKNQGDLPGAIAKWKAGLEVEPAHTLTHQALAVHLQKMGETEDAIAHAVKVTELEPNDPFSFTQLSVILQRCGRIPEAEDAMARSRMMQGH
ncbi:MAG TPA: tetratricopeptide repeat protein [Planctomycetaceae bacterium]|nr:tetratricopeptide repeat protein [Planctomycetaceae bacterium]